VSLRDIIAEFAQENGCIAGVSDSRELTGIRKTLEEAGTPFVSRDIAARVAPELVFPGCKSIIALGSSYAKSFLRVDDGRLRGIQSVACASRDYHVTLRGILEELASRLSRYTGFRYKVQVDTGPLVEREVARRAGLGSYGRNHQLISPVLGSYFNIGLLMVDAVIEADEPSPPEFAPCVDCGACVAHCPGGALVNGAPLDWRRCVSYITQKKGDLSPDEARIMGSYVYGCDVCQQVCPCNEGKTRGDVDDIESVAPDLARLIEMDDAEFTRRYGHTEAAWRGPGIIRRNALSSLVYNSQV